MYATWDDFVITFDKEYISSTVKFIKVYEFINWEQGDMIVIEHYKTTTSKSYFAYSMNLYEYAMVRMF